jgi:glyoxylase-like metal-dependent hydrolase (beta-lactamase superfamily II)
MARADEVHEIRPDLYFWQAYEASVKTDLSCCARRSAHGWVLIDPIPLTHSAGAEFLTLAPPRAIVLTNGNHARAAADYRARFSIPIYAHADAAAAFDFAIDHPMVDGATILETFTAIALPGAAAGEIALHAGDTLHVGDALIHLPSFGFSILPEKYCTDPRELRRSLGKLLRFPFDVLTFAHGLPLVKNAQQRLSELLA